MRTIFQRLLCLCLSLALVLVLFPTFRVEAAENDPLEYLTYTIAGGAAIINSCDNSITGHLEIPDTIEGRQVTTIDSYAFADCNNLTSVFIPDTVTSIGIFAFENCENLSSVRLSDKLLDLQQGVFINCRNLQSIDIPDSVQSIGACAFQWCYALETVIFGSSVQSVGDFAFRICPSLTEVVLPDSVTEIGAYSFSYCENLTQVTLGDQLATIDKFAFADCPLTELVFPSSGTRIKNHALNGIPSLKSVVFLGDPPIFESYALGRPSSDEWADDNFSDFDATIYYPIHNSKWTSNIQRDYGASNVPWVGIHSRDEGKSIVAATCTTEGTTSYVCTVCSETETVTVPALGHRWDKGNVVSQPTCTQDGVRRFTCTVCSDTMEEAVSATGHSWGNATVVTPPSCVDGTLGYICTQCGIVGNHESIPALGHSYQCTVEDATCTQPGRLVYTCSVCGDVQITETSSATGHQFQRGVWVTQPTCTEPGQKSYTCSSCGFVKDVTFPATGHKEVIDPAQPAACTATGLTEGKHCDTCGEVLIAQEVVPAAGHSYAAVVAPPTCTAPGSITTTCTACGDVTIGTVPATGHQFEDGSCIHCGEPEATTLPGDVNGDGKVNMGDVSMTFAHVRGKKLLTDDTALLAADATGDGKINMADVAKIFAHIRGKNSL